jgi:hypothetical protein
MLLTLNRSNGVYRITKIQPEHNHDMLPRRAGITKDLRRILQDLKSVGVENFRLVNFATIETGQRLTAAELGLARDAGDTNLTETESVISHMLDTDGLFNAFSVQTETGVGRAAVFTVSGPEKENWRRFGDVVFLDGTKIQNSLGWTTWPVTLVNDRKEIVSGGVLFTAYEREDVFVWFLDVLNEMSSSVGNKIRTIFTDEDSAMMTAILHYQADAGMYFAHRICLFHKMNNFSNRLKNNASDSAARAEGERLFTTIAYGKSSDTVRNAFDQLVKLFPGMTEYCQREVAPYMSHFRRFATVPLEYPERQDFVKEISQRLH